MIALSKNVMGIVGTVDNHVPEAVNKHKRISSGREMK